MWNAKVTNSNRIKDSLQITVTYSHDSDGDISFNELYSTPQAQTDDWLMGMIQNKLRQLEQLDIFEEGIKSKDVYTKVITLNPDTQEPVFSEEAVDN